MQSEQSTPLAPAGARQLLRKLRDLDLTAARILVSGGERVDVGGCLSRDDPADSALSYRLTVPGGAARRLEIAWNDGALHLVLADERGVPLAPARTVALVSDAAGRATAPELRARVDPAAADGRQFEHFLRRLVRGAFAHREVG